MRTVPFVLALQSGDQAALFLKNAQGFDSRYNSTVKKLDKNGLSSFYLDACPC